MTSIDIYVDELGHRLARFGLLAARPLAEVREHLLDSAQAIADEGVSADTAEREAIDRFGAVSDIAAELARVLNHERDPMERVFKLLSVTNSFTAVWGLAAVAMLNPDPELLAVTGVVSITTLAAALACMRRNVEPGTLVVGGVAQAAVGAAGITWALLGSRTQLEPQIAMALLMSLFLVQGLLSLIIGLRRQNLPDLEPTLEA